MNSVELQFCLTETRAERKWKIIKLFENDSDTSHQFFIRKILCRWIDIPGITSTFQFHKISFDRMWLFNLITTEYGFSHNMAFLLVQRNLQNISMQNQSIRKEIWTIPILGKTFGNFHRLVKRRIYEIIGDVNGIIRFITFRNKNQFTLNWIWIIILSYVSTFNENKRRLAEQSVENQSLHIFMSQNSFKGWSIWINVEFNL